MEIAVLIPCFNESATLATVLNSFKSQLPHAKFYVYDNCSTDATLTIAENFGATTKQIALRGKGHVVKQMFADIDAENYILVDGDATYDAASINPALELLQKNNLDMIVCTRNPVDDQAFRAGHQIGNRFFNLLVCSLFGNYFHDIFSGYRIFSKRFVKSFPAISQGFELEAEMTLHAWQLGLPFAEFPSKYYSRPKGSVSKLHTYRDGFRIFITIIKLFLYLRPMLVFGGFFILSTLIALALGMPLLINYIHTGLVPRIPTAIITVSFGLLACLSLCCGIILDSITRTRLEMKRCWYLLNSRV